MSTTILEKPVTQVQTQHEGNKSAPKPGLPVAEKQIEVLTAGKLRERRRYERSLWYVI